MVPNMTCCRLRHNGRTDAVDAIRPIFLPLGQARGPDRTAFEQTVGEILMRHPELAAMGTTGAVHVAAGAASNRLSQDATIHAPRHMHDEASLGALPLFCPPCRRPIDAYVDASEISA